MILLMFIQKKMSTANFQVCSFNEFEEEIVHIHIVAKALRVLGPYKGRCFHKLRDFFVLGLHSPRNKD